MISACMACGSANLNSSPGEEHTGQTALGLSGAMSGSVLCNDCGHYGSPLDFDSEKSRAAYAKSKTQGNSQEKKPKK